MLSKLSRGVLLGLVVFVLSSSSLSAERAGSIEPLRVGVFTDLHAHDSNNPLERLVMVHYRERLSACVEAMNTWPADLMIQLGDYVNGTFVLGADPGDPARIPSILEDAESIYAQFEGPRYHVIGNHDVQDLSKEEFLARVSMTQTYYSFDAGPYHFVVLDAQYDRDGEDCSHVFYVVQGNLPPFQLDWLRQDLRLTDRPTIVCVHQRLDVEYDFRSGGPEIYNALETRALLEESGQVIAVFQGHDHDGAYSSIEGIHYVTFRALIDRAEPTPPSWAAVTLDPTQRTVTIDGVGEQVDYRLEY